MADVIVVGGGVIGLSLAWELAGQGVDVELLEQGQPGQEASWAGAGILPPGNPEAARSPEARLRAESNALWPHWSERLREETGIDNGFHVCGGLEVRRAGSPTELKQEIDSWRAEGVEAEAMTSDEALEQEPHLNPDLTSAYRLSRLAQVRNPRHLKSLLAACGGRGVTIHPGMPMTGLERKGDRITGVRSPEGVRACAAVVLTAGAWSQALLEQVGCRVLIEPIRGQIVQLSAQPLPIRHVVQCGSRYLVPRTDGCILIGSTEERAGFDKRNTAGAMADLIGFASGLVPSLAEAKFERAWAGLRPASPDGLPSLGRVPGVENLFIAAGHFRAGLQLSPITAVLMRQLILGQPMQMPVDPFACDRHTRAARSGAELEDRRSTSLSAS